MGDSTIDSDPSATEAISLEVLDFGPIVDRAGEGRHYRIASLNPLAATVIDWNTLRLGEVVAARHRYGIDTPADSLAHVSPLGWHISLTANTGGRAARRRDGETLDAVFRPLLRTTRHGACHSELIAEGIRELPANRVPVKARTAPHGVDQLVPRYNDMNRPATDGQAKGGPPT